MFNVSAKVKDLPKRTLMDIASWLNENGYGTAQDLGIFHGLIEQDLAEIELEARSVGYRGGTLQWKRGMSGESEIFLVYDSTIYEDETEVAELFSPMES
jgi:hypothetical protein